MALGLEAAVDRLEDDPEVWVGVLCADTASKRTPVFYGPRTSRSSGSQGPRRTLDTGRGGFGGFVYRERVKPIVVAVDGLATAGGLEIVLAADVVVATTDRRSGWRRFGTTSSPRPVDSFGSLRHRSGGRDGCHPHR